MVLGLALGGCAPLRHGALPDPSGAPLQAVHRLRIVIFEMAGPDVPFHTGLIVQSGAETLIYDPAGMWAPPGQTRGEGEVIRNITPADEEAYLTRQGIRYSLGGWLVHIFDAAVSPAVARLAMRRAIKRPQSLPLHCAHNVSTLLSGLPGFSDIQPHRITGELLEDLLLRDDLTYTRRALDTTQSG